MGAGCLLQVLDRYFDELSAVVGTLPSGMRKEPYLTHK
jgi:hypothetical protein